MPPRTGRPPKPAEQKRRTGNPGKRKLPDLAAVTPLPASSPPDPPRPLGAAGGALWERAWGHGRAWMAETDAELLMLTCEQLDERQALRLKVLREGDWRERAALRALDKAVQDGLSMLGFTPTDRTRMGVAEVTVRSKLDDIANRRSQRSTRN